MASNISIFNLLLTLPSVFAVYFLLTSGYYGGNGGENGSINVEELLTRIDHLERVLLPAGGVASAGKWPDSDDSEVRYSKMSFVERLRYLEKLTKAHFNWVKDPHVWTRKQYKCENMTKVGARFGHHVCFDNWNYPEKADQSGNHDCVVYDFGIRKEPGFGEILATDYGCEVHGFDPSPVTTEWLKTTTRLDDNPNYHMHPYGAGGFDGELELYGYNWEQVSILFEKWGFANQTFKYVPGTTKTYLPVKTLGTVMKELGHTKLAVLKLDIEGSEYLFLQEIFDTIGCPPVDQLALEWHHFDFDWRYGSSPEITALTVLLNDCGFKQFFTRPEWVVLSDAKTGRQMSYGLSSYCRNCAPS